jgi:ribonuclease PH
MAHMAQDTGKKSRNDGRSSRSDGRQDDELRPVRIKRGFTKSAPGSVLIECGGTVVLCTASVENGVPPWLLGKGQGWVTAEYSMLPGSTTPRKRRDRGGTLDGRTSEIQRLIGRSLRAVTDMAALGERTITIDCDVLQADGGTRTASITGSFIALADAVRGVRRELPDQSRNPLRTNVAAVSVGIVAGRPVSDLPYEEDVAAEVDMNVVMTGEGQFVEVQGTGEGTTFSKKQFLALTEMAMRGIAELTEIQRKALGKHWPF